MDKQTFLNILEGKLIILNAQERDDILTEYSDVIDQKVKEGKSEFEAVQDFGDMKELVREIYDAYRISKDCDELVTSRELEIERSKPAIAEQPKIVGQHMVRSQQKPVTESEKDHNDVTNNEPYSNEDITNNYAQNSEQNDQVKNTLNERKNTNAVDQPDSYVQQSELKEEINEERKVNHEDHPIQLEEQAVVKNQEINHDNDDQHGISNLTHSEEEVGKPQNYETHNKQPVVKQEEDSTCVEEKASHQEECEAPEEEPESNLETHEVHNEIVMNQEKYDDNKEECIINQEEHCIQEKRQVINQEEFEAHDEDRVSSQDERESCEEEQSVNGRVAQENQINQLSSNQIENDKSRTTENGNNHINLKPPFIERLKTGAMNVLTKIKEASNVAYKGIRTGARVTYAHTQKGVQVSKRKINQVLDERNALKRLELSAIKAERDYTKTKEKVMLSDRDEQYTVTTTEKEFPQVKYENQTTTTKLKHARLLKKEISAEYKCLNKEKQKLNTPVVAKSETSEQYHYTMGVKHKGKVKEIKKENKALLKSQKLELKAAEKKEKSLQKAELRRVKQSKKFEHKLKNESNQKEIEIALKIVLFPIIFVFKLVFILIYGGFYLFLSFVYVTTKLTYFSLFLFTALLSAAGSILLIVLTAGFILAAFKFHYVYVYPGLVSLGIFFMLIGSTASVDALFKFLSRGVSTLFERTYKMFHRLFRRVVLGVRN